MGLLHGTALWSWPFDMLSSHLHMDVKCVQASASSCTWMSRVCCSAQPSLGSHSDRSCDSPCPVTNDWAFAWLYTWLDYIIPVRIGENCSENCADFFKEGILFIWNSHCNSHCNSHYLIHCLIHYLIHHLTHYLPNSAILTAIITAVLNAIFNAILTNEFTA